MQKSKRSKLYFRKTLLTNSSYCLRMTSLHLLRAKLSVGIVNGLLCTSRQFTKRCRSGEVGLGNHVLVFF